jgi:hypothetical protein
VIGYRDQDVVRRPIYSATGAKLGYLDGDWWVTLDGVRIFRIKRFKSGEVDKHISGGHYITWSEINDNC